MKKISRPSVLSLYRLYFQKGVRRLRFAFLRSRAYDLMVDLHKRSGLRTNICLIIDELRIEQINSLRNLAKRFFREVHRRASSVSNVINDISHALDEFAAECRSRTRSVRKHAAA